MPKKSKKIVSKKTSGNSKTTKPTRKTDTSSKSAVKRTNRNFEKGIPVSPLEYLKPDDKYFRELEGNIPTKAKRNPYEEENLSGNEFVDEELKEIKKQHYLSIRPERPVALGRKTSSELEDYLREEEDIVRMHKIEEEAHKLKPKTTKKENPNRFSFAKHFYSYPKFLARLPSFL